MTDSALTGANRAEIAELRRQNLAHKAGALPDCAASRKLLLQDGLCHLTIQVDPQTVPESN